MTTILGPSWKPKVAAILTLIGPTGLYFVLTSFAKMDDPTATKISGGVFALFAFFGLYTAKQDGVSNSPNPTLIAQPVISASSPSPHPSVSVQVEMAKPVAKQT